MTAPKRLHAPAAPDGPADIQDRPSARLRVGGLLASEAVKLRSLRSTWWLAVAATLVAAGGGWLQAYAFSAPESVSDLGLTPLSASRSVVETGAQSGQLVIAVLAVLVMTSEYASGTIHPTLTAVPRRLPVLGAKTAVVAVVAAVAGLLCSAVAYGVSWPMLDRAGLSVPPVAMASTAAAGAAYAVVVSVFALLVGVIVRSTAGAVVVVLGVVMVLPVALALVPGEANLGQLALTYGAQVISSAVHGPTAGLGVAVAVTLAWLTAGLAGGVATLVRRDA